MVLEDRGLFFGEDRRVERIERKGII